jgi:hypothetical protein
MLGVEKIVGIEELHEFASRGEYGHIPSSAHAGIGSSVIGRTIVNNYDLNLRVVLVQAILDQGVDEPRPIVDWDNDAHFW